VAVERRARVEQNMAFVPVASLTDPPQLCDVPPDRTGAGVNVETGVAGGVGMFEEDVLLWQPVQARIGIQAQGDPLRGGMPVRLVPTCGAGGAEYGMAALVKPDIHGEVVTTGNARGWMQDRGVANGRPFGVQGLLHQQWAFMPVARQHRAPGTLCGKGQGQ